MSSTSSEFIWFRRLLHELGVFVVRLAPLFGDNTSVIRIADNSVFH